MIEDDEIIGVHPLYFSASGVAYRERLVHSGIHRQAGLALAGELDKPTMNAARSMAMAKVFDLAEQENADRIQLGTHNLAPINRSHHRQEIPFWVVDYGSHLGLRFLDGGYAPCPGMTTCCADQIVDLTADDDRLFERLDPACRRAVRKATKAGLTFEIASDPAALAKYMALACRSAVRTGEAPPSTDYYRTILDTFNRDGRAAIGFALSNGTPVAAIFAIADKGAVNFLAGVSEPKALSMRCNDFAHWQLMLWAKHQGFEVYRLGPWFPEVPRSWPISRVSLFKTKFGGRATTIIQGSLFEIQNSTSIRR